MLPGSKARHGQGTKGLSPAFVHQSAGKHRKLGVQYFISPVQTALDVAQYKDICYNNRWT